MRLAAVVGAVAALALCAACTDAQPKAEQPTPTDDASSQSLVQLTKGDACGDVYFWATTKDGDTAVTVSVQAMRRSRDKQTTIPFSVLGDLARVAVLRGTQLARNFCTDLPSLESEPTERLKASSGTGTIVINASAPNQACGNTEGTLTLDNLVASDGTRFAPINVTSNQIGCYAG
ncbi:MAG: hypothetical protein ABI586_11370 [Candidatus Nanopelagicales bacterium]